MLSTKVAIGIFTIDEVHPVEIYIKPRRQLPDSFNINSIDYFRDPSFHFRTSL